MKAKSQAVAVTTSTTTSTPLRNNVSVGWKGGRGSDLPPRAMEMLQELLRAAGFAGVNLTYNGVTSCMSHKHSGQIRVGTPRAQGVEITICTAAHDGYIGRLAGAGVSVQELHRRLSEQANNHDDCASKDYFLCGVVAKSTKLPLSPPAETEKFEVIQGGLGEVRDANSIDLVVADVLDDVDNLTLGMIEIAGQFGDEPFLAVDGATILGLFYGHEVKRPTELETIFRPLFDKYVILRWLSQSEKTYVVTPTAKKLHGPRHDAGGSAGNVPSGNSTAGDQMEMIKRRIEELNRLKSEYSDAKAKVETIDSEVGRLRRENATDEAKIRQVQRDLKQQIENLSREAENQTSTLRSGMETRRVEVRNLETRKQDLTDIIQDTKHITANEELANLQKLLLGS